MLLSTGYSYVSRIVVLAATSGIDSVVKLWCPLVSVYTSQRLQYGCLATLITHGVFSHSTPGLGSAQACRIGQLPEGCRVLQQ
jgi:hypothetical protein